MTVSYRTIDSDVVHWVEAISANRDNEQRVFTLRAMGSEKEESFAFDKLKTLYVNGVKINIL